MVILVKILDFDQCMVGARYKKATTLLTSRLQSSHYAVESLENPGRCTRANHEVAIGKMKMGKDAKLRISLLKKNDSGFIFLRFLFGGKAVPKMTAFGLVFSFSLENVVQNTPCKIEWSGSVWGGKSPEWLTISVISSVFIVLQKCKCSIGENK